MQRNNNLQKRQKVRKVCAECGSGDVVVILGAEWDVEKQAHCDIDEFVCPSGLCYNCGSDGAPRTVTIADEVLER